MDILQSELFLERLKLWRSSHDEHYVNLLLAEHIRPLAIHIMAQARFLPYEEREDAVTSTMRRSVRGLPAYDPARHRPFKYFARIAYNERNRAIKAYKTSKRAGDISIHEDDYESAAVYTDQKAAARCSAEGLDFKQLMETIPRRSPEHKAVFDSLVYGEGWTLRTGRPSIKAVAAETGLELERIKEIIADCRELIRETTRE